MLDADRRDELARRPERDDLAVVHDGHALAEPLRFVHVVRRQQNRPARALELFDQVPELAARLRIEPRRRLVEKQQLRVADERAREREPLLLPARKRADARAPLLLELHERDHVLGRRTLREEAAEERTVSSTVSLSESCVSWSWMPSRCLRCAGVGLPPHPEHLDVARVGAP